MVPLADGNDLRVAAGDGGSASHQHMIAAGYDSLFGMTEDPEYDKRGRRISGEGPDWDTRPPDRPDVRDEYGVHPTVQALVWITAFAVLILVIRLLA